MNIELLKNRMIERLEENLADDLFYHNPDHTLSVFEVAQEIATRHGLSDEEVQLLNVACLYHDAGFIYGPKEHETRSCQMVREELPAMGFTDQQIEVICGMVMATKIPQSPKNLLEEVICDADLFYLGTPDYDQIADLLYREFQAYDVLQDEGAWINLQIKFLENHNYFSDFLKDEHTRIKLGHLARLKSRQV
ncbi:MAG: HD domain-containing protein [Bacteroidia bacterium]|nr:HD domain-containing protein [Bacteroidia bacterium]